jgi:hypothetical protein
MAQTFLPGGTVSLDDVSPFTLHLLYQACIILSTSLRESASETVSQSLSVLREVLNQVGKRWNAAGADPLLLPTFSYLQRTNKPLDNYVAILGAQEIMNSI